MPIQQDPLGLQHYAAGQKKKGNTTGLSYRWALQLAIEGDLRFFSHRDMMRAMERIANRAKLPLRYSRGFNPRPVLSLPCPRPVGVATRDDRMVFALDGPADVAEFRCRLNRQAPEGLRFLAARLLRPGESLRARRVDYELGFTPGQAQSLRRRLEELKARPTWPTERQTKGGRNRRNAPGAIRTIDVRPMVGELGLQEEVLHFACVPWEQKWAKPSEVLGLLGLAEPEYLVQLVRTRIHDDM